MVVLDGDATILPPATADELVTEVGRCDARRYVWLMRHVRRCSARATEV
jgi:hypothetical protein